MDSKLMGSLDEKLAGQIVDTLISQAIVTPAEKTALVAQLSGGRVTAEDWLRLVEKKQERDKITHAN